MFLHCFLWQEMLKFFANEILQHVYLIHGYSDKVFMGSVKNRSFLSFPGVSLEITLNVPLTKNNSGEICFQHFIVLVFKK